MFRILLNPEKDFTVTLSGRKLLLERVGIDAGKFQEALIQRASEVVFAVLAGQCGAAFIEHARQNYIAAEPHPRAAGRTFSQIRSMIIKSHRFLILDFQVWFSGKLLPLPLEPNLPLNSRNARAMFRPTLLHLQ